MNLYTSTFIEPNLILSGDQPGNVNIATFNNVHVIRARGQTEEDFIDAMKAIAFQ